MLGEGKPPRVDGREGMRDWSGGRGVEAENEEILKQGKQL